MFASMALVFERFEASVRTCQRGRARRFSDQMGKIRGGRMIAVMLKGLVIA
jgi:hypothetical protein